MSSHGKINAEKALTKLGIAGCAILGEDWKVLQLGGLHVYSDSACAAPD